MKKTPFVLAAVCGLGLTSATLVRAADPVPPPKVIQIYREIVKPGHGVAHAKTEAGWPAAFAKASWPTHYFALTSTSGPGEAWFITGFESYAAYEKDLKAAEQNAALQSEIDRLGAADGEHLSGTSSLFASYRDDLSYRAPVSIPEMRHFMVTTYRVKPGRSAEFVAARKLVQAAHEKVNMDEHWATYQVISGAPTGTYLLFLPIKSMAEMDSAQESHGKAYEAALNQSERQELALRYVHQHGSITNRQYRALSSTSENTALRDLEALVERGALRAIGEKRGRRYVL